jgi:hypothetical protein
MARAGRVAELGEQGLMQPAGLEAFARRRESRSGIDRQVRHLQRQVGRA